MGTPLVLTYGTTHYQNGYNILMSEQIFFKQGTLLQNVAACNDRRSHVNVKVHLNGESDNQIVQLLDLDQAMFIVWRF